MNAQTIVGMKKKALALGGAAAVLVGMGSCGDETPKCDCNPKYHTNATCPCNGIDCVCVEIKKLNTNDLGFGAFDIYGKDPSILSTIVPACINIDGATQAAFNAKIKEVWALPGIAPSCTPDAGKYIIKMPDNWTQAQMITYMQTLPGTTITHHSVRNEVRLAAAEKSVAPIALFDRGQAIRHNNRSVITAIRTARIRG